MPSLYTQFSRHANVERTIRLIFLHCEVIHAEYNVRIQSILELNALDEKEKLKIDICLL